MIPILGGSGHVEGGGHLLEWSERGHLSCELLAARCEELDHLGRIETLARTGSRGQGRQEAIRDHDHELGSRSRYDGVVAEPVLWHSYQYASSRVERVGKLVAENAEGPPLIVEPRLRNKDACNCARVWGVDGDVCKQDQRADVTLQEAGLDLLDHSLGHEVSGSQGRLDGSLRQLEGRRELDVVSLNGYAALLWRRQGFHGS